MKLNGKRLFLRSTDNDGTLDNPFLPANVVEVAEGRIDTEEGPPDIDRPGLLFYIVVTARVEVAVNLVLPGEFDRLSRQGSVDGFGINFVVFFRIVNESAIEEDMVSVQF